MILLEPAGGSCLNLHRRFLVWRVKENGKSSITAGKRERRGGGGEGEGGGIAGMELPYGNYFEGLRHETMK
jgi:hypothetical protein